MQKRNTWMGQEVALHLWQKISYNYNKGTEISKQNKMIGLM